MKTNTWMVLREYIDLTIQISNRSGRDTRLGDRRSQLASEHMRLRHSELETLIRESCEDWEIKAPTSPADRDNNGK